MHGTRVWVVNVHLDRVGFVTPGNDRVPVSRDYFKGTYTKLDFPIAPRIDFLFVSAALGRKNARVIPKSPGDHFPVRADILIPGQG
jgi:endonuclease/exonuclease/phosphatase family metal-dependent hydrolase